MAARHFPNPRNGKYDIVAQELTKLSRSALPHKNKAPWQAFLARFWQMGLVSARRQRHEGTQETRYKQLKT